ncbi:MAG TPA: thymidylate synthase [Candidatus Paceibacterota bacterium]|nr:thymidylate synthase [Candidatus Paceibacterota bacterium]HMP18940.1 thymidylate synthase [Candidatus Paceibacterota bacterium]HMP85499.1 thymidylate synthase [Candidatus Paceibacterota bacterium]
MTKFDQIYQNILNDILKKGVREFSERTGLECAVLPGIHFSIEPEKDGFPLLTLRKIPIKSIIAEQIWFLSGARKPEDFLRNYTKIWDSFTNPGDVVTVAYGYRWRKHFGRDQIKSLITLLKKEPSSRQAVVVTWDPGQDGLGAAKKANVPCPYTFTVNIFGGKLHLHNIVRSNDMMLGFPFDVAGFCLLQYILAQELGVGVGTYSHSISNAHIYENHFSGAKEIISRKNSHKKIKLVLPKNSFSRSEKKDGKLLDEIFENLNGQYKPMDKIEGLKIAI